jgi:hypothetical protein
MRPLAAALLAGTLLAGAPLGAAPGSVAPLFAVPVSPARQARPPIALQLGPVTVVTWPAESSLAVGLARQATKPADWPGLGRRSAGPLRMIVVRDAARMRELTRGGAPTWGAALAVPEAHTIVIRADGGDPPATLRHELAHLVLHAALRTDVPRWFDEGYAAVAAGEIGRLEQLSLNLTVARGAIAGLTQLDEALRADESTASTAYGLAASAVLELARRNPTGTLAPLLHLLGQGVDFDTAVRRTTGLTLDRFEELWQASTRRRYGLVAWVAAGGAWGLIAILALGAARLRRRSDRARRAALDVGWPAPPPEPPEPGPGHPDDVTDELDRPSNPM